MDMHTHLYTLTQPPQDTVKLGASVSYLLFQCSIGPLASQLLANADFEPYVSAYHRSLSAVSIEALCISGHYLTQIATKKTIFAPHSFPLFSSRAANPALCISFFWPPEAQENKRLMSLILYNEFQMPLGLFDHNSRRFLIYTQQALPEAQAFFESEKGPELLKHLIQLEQSGLLETYMNRPNLRPAIHFGFNRSFGHTHWNDVLGLLHLRQSSISSRLSKNLTTLQGPYAWVDPKLLTPEPRYKFESVPELTEHALKEGLSVQVPLGFSIDKKYVDFWKNEVSALAQPDRWGAIQEMRRKCSPIIAFNIRFGEIWRRGWKDCFVQLPQIISALHARYPNLGVVFDGLTAYHGESHDKADSRTSNLPEGFLAALPDGVPVVDISGQSIGLKTAAYSAVDYAISQWGSGETIPMWVYALPSISISAEPDIVASYGSPNVITRQCKPEIQDATRHGTFLPIDHLVIESDGYSIRLPETVEFILSHMQRCGLASSQVVIYSEFCELNKPFVPKLEQISQLLFKSGRYSDGQLISAITYAIEECKLKFFATEVKHCLIKSNLEAANQNGFKINKVTFDQISKPAYICDPITLKLFKHWEQIIKEYFLTLTNYTHIFHAKNIFITYYKIWERYDLFTSTYDLILDEPVRFWLKFLEGKGIYKSLSDDLTHILVDFNRSPIIHIKDKCVFIGSHSNWGHWIYDYLSKMTALENYSNKTKLKFVFGQLNDNQRSCLKIIGINPDQIIELENNNLNPPKRYFFEDIINIEAVPKTAAMKYLRRTFSQVFDENDENPERIYISRRSETPRHRIANIDEVEKVFRDNGFCIVDNLKILPLEAQIKLFNNAKIVAMQSGAEIGNFSFLPEKTVLIMLITAYFHHPMTTLQTAQNLFIPYCFGSGLPMVFISGCPSNPKDASVDSLAIYDVENVSRSINEAIKFSISSSRCKSLSK